MRIYIAGPVTGTSDYRARFASAAARLRAAGYDVRNPTGIARPDRRAQDSDWMAWMRTTTRMLTTCDGVALLPGWQRSRGAIVEADWAESVGLPVHELGDWLAGPPGTGLPPTTSSSGRTPAGQRRRTRG